MKFDIITIFPEAFKSYLDASMIKRGQVKKLVDIRVHDLRKFVRDRRKKVDDRPYGGGPGMVLKIEPIIRALNSIVKLQATSYKLKTRIILFAAGGKQFNAAMASDFAKKYDRIIMIAGHYEGVDARLQKVLHVSGFMLQEISIGPYVLTGGELPAMVLVDAVSRHIPGFLGKEASLEEKRYGVGVPVYTRPEVFIYRGKKYSVPKLLLSGNHAIIEKWRRKQAKKNQ
ncbi:MAG: tRNA (guanosine(37)-N1)-methyltransferase TrmD [bacterium]|nr:tRNA (guanosine(37)-N1)-methyltransferase TrmD [bacterium]